MLKPLLRVVPAMSGNVKLACRLDSVTRKDSSTFEASVRSADMLPLSSSLRRHKNAAGLLGSSWEYDLKRFYRDYADDFFRAPMEDAPAEMAVLDKSAPPATRDADFECGVSRVSACANGGEDFMFFAPVWIEDGEDVPGKFVMTIDFESPRWKASKTVEIPIASNAASSNYIYKYLKTYADRLTPECVFLDPPMRSAAYFGIDLRNGGFTKKADPTVSALYSVQLPMQQFDSLICGGFKRNELALKQVMPLCWCFSIEDFLTHRERQMLAGCSVVFSGKYITGSGASLPWYDFDFNYTDSVQEILGLNDRYALSYKSGKSANLMNEGFPAFHECRLRKWAGNGKLAVVRCKWKMAYSLDAHPYIANMSWAYSVNQDNNYKYREFPTMFSPMTGIADVEQMRMPTGELQWFYDLKLPINPIVREMYDAESPGSTSKYDSIISNYCGNWFDVISGPRPDFNDASLWSAVQNGKSYRNGILYSIANVYEEGAVAPEDKIDKFGVFVYADTSYIKSSETLSGMRFTDHAVTVPGSPETVGASNCATDPDFVSRAWDPLNRMVDHTASSGSCIAPPAIFSENAYGSWVEMSWDNGLDWYELNRYWERCAVDVVLNPESFGAYLESGNGAASVRAHCAYEAEAYIDALTAGELRSYIGWARKVLSYMEYDKAAYISGQELIKTFRGTALMSDGSSEDPAFSQQAAVFSCAYSPGFLFSKEGSGFVCTDIGRQTLPGLKKATPSVDFGWLAEPHMYDDWSAPKQNEPEYALPYPEPEQWSAPYKNLIAQDKDFVQAGAVLHDTDDTFDTFLENAYAADPVHWPLGRYDIGSPQWIEWEIYRTLAPVASSYVSSVEDGGFAEYEWLPNLTRQSEPVTSQVFISRGFRGRMYGDNGPLDKLDKDKDVLYVLKYNLEPLMRQFYREYSEKTETEINDIIRNALNPGTRVPMHAPFMSKEHMSLWVSELHKDENYAEPPGFAWSSQIFLHEKCLVWTAEHSIEAKMRYWPVNEIMKACGMDPTDFKSFYDAVEFSPKFSAFRFTDPALAAQFPHEWFDIGILDGFVRMNSSIWWVMNLEREVRKAKDPVYKDLYIYRIADPSEYDSKFYTPVSEKNSEGQVLYDYKTGIQHEMISVYWDPAAVSSYDIWEADSVLAPMFNSPFVEEMASTDIYEAFVTENVWPCGFYDGDRLMETYYRYGKNNCAAMICLREEETAMLEKKRAERGLTAPVKRWSDYSNQNRCSLDVTDDGASMGYDRISRINVAKVDGVTYGWYLLHARIDNTYSTFRIRGSSSAAGKDASDSIKYIQWINGEDIVAKPGYIAKIFKSVFQFMNISLLKTLTDLNTVMKPLQFYLNAFYSESAADSSNGSDDLDIAASPGNYSRQRLVLQRYCDMIKPLITECSAPDRLWFLKTKDTNARLIDSGAYPSIGDSVLYSLKGCSISSFPGMRVYTQIPAPDDAEKAASVEYDFGLERRCNCRWKEEWAPLEYKWYNSSKAVYLPSEITVRTAKRWTYEELLEAETRERTLKTFMEKLDPDGVYSGDPDASLFLFNKYKAEYDSAPECFDATGTKKLYSLMYRFTLL